MADFTNRQLAEIIAQSAEKINTSVLRERKIANELEQTLFKLQREKEDLQEKINELKNTSIEPDLRNLNSFYESKTDENVKLVNSRLKVPNLSLYLWLSSIGILIISFFALYLAYQQAFLTKTEVQEQYRVALLKENAIIPKEHEQLLKDMDQFLRNNPKTKDKFMQSRKGRNK